MNDQGIFCARHEALEKKIDTIIERQLTYMESQSDTCVDIQYIKDSVENGLKSKVFETAAEIKELHEKIKTLEDFSWFREWVTDIRNNLFKYVVKWACIGGVGAIVYITLIKWGVHKFPQLLGIG